LFDSDRNAGFHVPILLGLMGLLPQAIFLAFVLSGSEWRWVALAMGWGYAALIFSFLGGVYWGLALANQRREIWLYLAAVVPSLIALASYFPWTMGWEWPGPSMAILGLCLIISPLVDYQISKVVTLPESWMPLRWCLSIGLGVMTLVLAVTA
jgi:Protein of unknown function (DUF3429)